MNVRMLRVFAVLFALLAVSNLTKGLEMQAEHGFVFLGRRLSGGPNLIVSPLFAVWLGTYAWALWNARRLALPLGIAYAGWVPLNIFLFTLRSPEELGSNSLFGITYTIIAVGVSWGAALAAYSVRDELD